MPSAISEFEFSAAFHSGGGVLRGERLRRGVTAAICTYKRPESLARLLESLWKQEGFAYPVLVIDASPDPSTETRVAELCATHGGEPPLSYYRVKPEQRGLTKQRNIALELSGTDLTAFFDDDIEFVTPCLTALEGVLRKEGEAVVGASPTINNQATAPTLLWRLRRGLAIVSSLEPGRYEGSGFSVPWSFASGGDLWQGDWLPGCAMVWRTEDARAEKFLDGFEGYGLSEDLEFSIRMGRRGKLLVCSWAHANHWHEPAGRESPFRLGYMEIHNRFQIHKLRFRERRLFYVTWFVYAWTLDTLMLTRYALGASARQTVQQIAGRLRAAWDLAVAPAARQAS